MRRRNERAGLVTIADIRFFVWEHPSPKTPDNPGPSRQLINNSSTCASNRISSESPVLHLNFDVFSHCIVRRSIKKKKIQCDGRKRAPLAGLADQPAISSRLPSVAGGTSCLLAPDVGVRRCKRFVSRIDCIQGRHISSFSLTYVPVFDTDHALISLGKNLVLFTTSFVGRVTSSTNLLYTKPPLPFESINTAPASI